MKLRLTFKDVQPGRRYMTTLKSSDEIFIHDKSTPGGVDDDSKSDDRDLEACPPFPSCFVLLWKFDSGLGRVLPPSMMCDDLISSAKSRADPSPTHRAFFRAQSLFRRLVGR